MADKKIKQGVSLIVAIMVAGLLVAFIGPVALDAFNDDRSDTLTQTEGDEYILTGSYNTTLTDVSQTGSTIDVLINETDSNTTGTISGLAEGANETVTVDGDDFNVTNDEVANDTVATVTYEYPTDAGWSTAEAALFGIVALLLLVAIALYVVAMAIDQTNF